MSRNERDASFPYGRVPRGNYTEADVTTTTDNEEEAIAVTCRGILKGQPVVIVATANATSGANSDGLTLTVYQEALGADTVGESVNQSITATNDDSGVIIVAQAAYQTNPTYVLGVTTVNATGNSTINNSGIVVIPVG